MARIEIDEHSGFCFGVVTAIRKAEEELDRTGHLYCLGDIVHNSNEVERLKAKGLITIDHEQLKQLHDVKVLLRAHGEPPETYRIAAENHIEIIDATCPVVLQLQRKIKTAYDSNPPGEAQIVIYGKNGHAEVNGLVAQTNGEAIVVEGDADVEQIDFSKPLVVFSQTTKSLEGFERVVERIKCSARNKVEVNDTICRKVANRIPQLRDFASRHDVILFVSGGKSSNGRQLFNVCREVNPHTYFIQEKEDLQAEMFREARSVGISGATSTPKWVMEEIADKVKSL